MRFSDATTDPFVAWLSSEDPVMAAQAFGAGFIAAVERACEDDPGNTSEMERLGRYVLAELGKIIGEPIAELPRGVAR